MKRPEEEALAAAPSDDAPAPPSLGRRIRRVARWVLLGTTIVVVLAVLAVLLILAKVNHPAVKSRVQSLVKSNTGLEIDYDDLSISLRHGVTARRLTIASPPELAAHAPHFVDVEDLEIKTSLWSLPFRDLGVDAIRVGSIEVNVVADADGATTLSLLFPPSDKPDEEKPKKPPTPRSKSLAGLPTIAAKEIHVGSIAGTFIQVDGDQVVRSSQLGGLGITGTLSTGAAGLEGTELHLHATDETGLRVKSETPAETRTGRFELGVDLTGASDSTIVLAARLAIIEQTLVTTTRPLSELLDLAVSVELDAAEGKTSVTIGALSLLDDALSAQLEATIPDGVEGALVASAHGKLAVRLPSLPVNVPGVAVDELSLDVDLDRLSFADGVFGGTFKLEGSVAALAATTAEQMARLVDVTVTSSGRFEGPLGTAKLELGAGSARAEAGDAAIEVARLTVVGDGEITSPNGNPRASRGGVTIGLGEALATSAGSRLAVTALEANVVATNWLDGILESAPMLVTMKAAIATLDGAAPGQVVAARQLVIDGQVRELALSEGSRFGVAGLLDASAGLADLRARASKNTISGQAVKLSARAPLDLSEASGAVSLSSLSVRQGRSDPIVTRAADLRFETTRPLALAPETAGSASFELDGRVGQISVGREHRGALSRLSLRADKSGPTAYKAGIDARSSKLVVAGAAVAGGLDIRVRGDGDLASPRLALVTEIDGPGKAEVRAEIDAKFVRRGSRLVYDATISARSLDAVARPLRALTKEVDRIALDGASLRVTASGDLGGVLAARRGGMPTLAGDPLRTIIGRQKANIDAVGVAYTDKSLAVAIPRMVVVAQSTHGKNGKTDGSLTVDVDELSYASGADRILLKGFSEKLVATSEEPLTAGTLKVSSRTVLASATQTYFADYDVDTLTVDGSFEVERLRSLFVRKLTLINPGAGTRLRVNGALERSSAIKGRADATIFGREALTLEGEISQNAAPLARWGVAKKAKGTIVVPFRLESGDLVSYRLNAKLIARHVDLDLPDSGLLISDLNGVIPIVEEIALLPGGVVLLPGPRTNVLSRTRFFDVHPFLDSEHYVTAKQIRVGGQTLGPFAGNVRLARSILSIDQLEVGYRSGTIAGQFLADYRDGDPHIAARLNITGVRPSKGTDVLDANATIAFVPRSLELNGKVQIVRISRSHLLELLDIIDPYRETVNVNKVRLALKVGFPRFVRLLMKDGALDAKVDLGGVAKVIRIDEIKSVPLGPLLQKYVAPAIDSLLPRRRAQAIKETP